MHTERWRCGVDRLVNPSEGNPYQQLYCQTQMPVASRPASSPRCLLLRRLCDLLVLIPPLHGLLVVALEVREVLHLILDHLHRRSRDNTRSHMHSHPCAAVATELPTLRSYVTHLEQHSAALLDACNCDLRPPLAWEGSRPSSSAPAWLSSAERGSPSPIVDLCISDRSSCTETTAPLALSRPRCATHADHALRPRSGRHLCGRHGGDRRRRGLPGPLQVLLEQRAYVVRLVVERHVFGSVPRHDIGVVANAEEDGGQEHRHVEAARDRGARMSALTRKRRPSSHNDSQARERRAAPVLPQVRREARMQEARQTACMSAAVC